MKRFPFLVGLLVLVGVSSSALAQTASPQMQRVILFGRRLSVSGLLRNEAVQIELNLTGEQKKCLQEKVPALRPIGKQGYANLSPEQRKKRFEFTKLEEVIQAVLDVKQKKRLYELELQLEGASALLFPEVAKKLKLDDAQNDKLKNIERDGLNADQFDFRNASAEERRKHLVEYGKRREKLRKDLIAVLTAEQKDAFTKMQGKKFEFPQRTRRRRNQE